MYKSCCFANPDLLLFFNFAVLIANIIVVALASYFIVEPPSPSSRLNKISDLWWFWRLRMDFYSWVWTKYPAKHPSGGQNYDPTMQVSGEAQVEDVIICYIDEPLFIQKYTWKRMAEATTKWVELRT